MIKKLEDLEIWKLARIINNDIFKIIKSDLIKKDFSLIDQMNRSAASAMDNIAEGYGRNGKKEFIHFLSCSKGSCSELKSQLYRSLDRKYILQNDFEIYFDKVDHLEKMTSKFMRNIKDNPSKGWKFED